MNLPNVTNLIKVDPTTNIFTVTVCIDLKYLLAAVVNQYLPLFTADNTSLAIEYGGVNFRSICVTVRILLI